MVLRKPDILIGVIIGLIGTTIVEFARDPLELGNIWQKVHRELNYRWKHRRVKEGKKNPQDKDYEASERISGGIIDENAKQVKENVTAKLQDIDKRCDDLLELFDSLQTLYGENKHASLAASTGDEADRSCG